MSLFDADSVDIIKFAVAWAKLDENTRMNVQALVDDWAHNVETDIDDLDPDAIEKAARQLDGLNAELDDHLAHYLRRYTESQWKEEKD